jgi:hypothetical protein
LGGLLDIPRLPYRWLSDTALAHMLDGDIEAVEQ